MLSVKAIYTSSDPSPMQHKSITSSLSNSKTGS